MAVQQSGHDQCFTPKEDLIYGLKLQQILDTQHSSAELKDEGLSLNNFRVSEFLSLMLPAGERLGYLEF